jgi:hypothetical protein
MYTEGGKLDPRIILFEKGSRITVIQVKYKLDVLLVSSGIDNQRPLRELSDQ